MLKTTYSLLTIAVLSLTSCKNKTTVQEDIKSNTTVGTWKVTKYVDSGNDETIKFNGSTFTFSDGGTATVTDSKGFTTAGSWTIHDSNSKDDTQDDLHFVLSFPANSRAEELNDDWDFISQSNTKLELTDVSGGNGGTNYLTFEKN
jgi:hypothetical protein